MPLRNVYYLLKPFIPWHSRALLRRWIVACRHIASKDVWPIHEQAGRTPNGWPGWPGGKRFAFVLTHDVEGTVGAASSINLMQLEVGLGFRSSFNFVPEGEYRVSRELRSHLVSNGFEVGVHDLRHDGKLYRSRHEFREKAQRINGYLKEWQAVGFRSAFMLHNLDWLRELDVLYDLSTFDTDPFEPQPDGVETIFPFWVAGRDRRPGYVELPYTLGQDSTLFLFLRQKSIGFWKEKLDWIVKRGGMALVNVHPDYIDFSGETVSWRKFPVRFYEEFLGYVGRHYANQFWNPLPRELAEWYRHQIRGWCPVP